MKNNSLSGVFTPYPLEQGVFDWAIDNDMHNIKPEKIMEKSNQPDFIGGFTIASQAYYHYKHGARI
ncbi:DUF7710 domain-containing protein [Pseudoalteromonas rubra]|uniref:DUF7710 domain-containing protein n=1 Tax=Pseudoalteromonas rubra TaxID=43658 RepID=UPI003B586303